MVRNVNWIHCFLCFCYVSLMAFFLVTWEEIYTAEEGVHFFSLLNAAIFLAWDLPGNSDVHLSLVLFITLISWSTVGALCLKKKKKLSGVIGALKSPPCALSHWPSLSSIHHSTNGNARREAPFCSPLWIPLEVQTHNRTFFKPLTLPL